MNLNFSYDADLEIATMANVTVESLRLCREFKEGCQSVPEYSGDISATGEPPISIKLFLRKLELAYPNATDEDYMFQCRR